MGNWTSNVILEPIEFDGDSIVFTCGRLTVEDMLALSKFFDQEKGVLRFDDQLQALNTAQGLIGKYVRRIDGMRMPDGASITVEQFSEVAREFYFVPLLGELLANLVTISTVGKSEKNS
ncbi:MAG: hypothetical protein A2W25_15240 [candidate division Zixibacteria bacterium RBG_16_53_22]|nr:MAG: hypothetical protein A2W25_15240 [candidate division Zixibacteria bacterium RBG_16_53_22]